MTRIVTYTSTDGRVVRGGSWNFPGRICRSGFRSMDALSIRSDHLGFRIVRIKRVGTLVTRPDTHTYGTN